MDGVCDVNTNIGVAWVWGLWGYEWYQYEMCSEYGCRVWVQYCMQAVNAVDTVEAVNSDLGYIYWKTHFILLGGI